jgi:hypothetical protein
MYGLLFYLYLWCSRLCGGVGVSQTACAEIVGMQAVVGFSQTACAEMVGMQAVVGVSRTAW